METGRKVVAAANRCRRIRSDEGMRAYVAAHWTAGALLPWLGGDDSEAVAAAATCLGCIGDASLSPSLAPLLHHADPAVTAAAELALWGVWFRSGSASSQSRIGRAVLLVQKEQLDEAVALLNAIIAGDPGFAEAWNQRAIAWYLRSDFCRSMADCKQVMALNPYHFGAMAGMGHCFAHLGRHAEALDCYHAALAIHPRMDGIRQSIRQLRLLQPVSRRPQAAWTFLPTA